MAACSPEAPPPADPAPEPVALQEDSPAPAPLDMPATAPPSSEVIIERVESVMISRPSEQPEAVTILASGLVGSRGWSRPRLVPAAPDDESDTVNFNFVATSPEREMPENEPQAVEARFEMSMVRPEVEAIRIIGATNELTAFVGN